MPDEKKKLSNNVKCGHCQNVAPMEIAGDHCDSETLYCSGEPIKQWMGTSVELLICPSCRKPNVRTGEWGAWQHPDADPDWTALYPVPCHVPLGLPKKVASAYEAAGKIMRANDANAFAVLLGRVLDRVCEDKGAVGGTLDARLHDLADRDIMPRSLAEMAHRLRALRNIGGHANLGELTEEEIPILDDLCRAILEYVYKRPRAHSASAAAIGQAQEPGRLTHVRGQRSTAGRPALESRSIGVSEDKQRRMPRRMTRREYLPSRR